MPKFAKKREYVEAVQWTGAVTSEVAAILGDRKYVISANRQISFGGWQADAGDWLISHDSNKIGVIGDKVFDLVYEPIDANDPTRQPTREEHAADVHAFVDAVDAILLDGLRLSREDHPKIFHASDALQFKLRSLLEDRTWTAQRDERQRIKDRIIKDIL